MNNNPLVSILIPVYKREQIVRRAIESALNQSYRNIEIICVDNDSPDDTFKTLQEYHIRDSRVKVYKQATNVGPVRNWVTCLEKSSGEYIKFLWSDDEIAEECIELLLEPFLSNSEIGFSFSKVNIIYNGKKIIDEYRIGKSGLYNTSYFMEISANLVPGKSAPVSPGCALFKKEIIVKYLHANYENDMGLDFSKYGAGNDSMLFYGACKDYTKFYFIDKTLSVFYGGEDSFSVSNNLIRYYQYILNMFSKNCFEKVHLKKFFYKYWTVQNLFYKNYYIKIKQIKYLYFICFILNKIRYRFFYC